MPPSTLSPQPGSLLRQPNVRRLLIVALLAEIGYAVLNISAMPIYLKFDRGYGASVIGLVLVAFLLSEAAFKGIMGSLADRAGCKRLIVLGPSLSVASALATLAVPHQAGIWETIMLMALRATDGLAAAMIWPAAFALMGDLVKDAKRQEAMSLLNTCYLAGIALALPLGGFANDLTGSRSASLYLAAGLFVAVALLGYFGLPFAGGRHETHPHADGITPYRFLDAVKKIPGFMALALITFTGIGFPMVVIKLFAKEQFGMSESAFGLLVLPAAGAMAFFSVPMARIGDRIGRVRAVHLGMGMCAAGLALIALGAFVPAARLPSLMLLAAIPVGVGFMLAIPAWYASVSDVEPARRASNLGAVMTAQGVGAILGMPLGAIAYDQLQALGAGFGRYSPFIGCFVFVAVGWIISLRILRAPSA